LPLYYLDSSALVKLYVLEPGTERMLQLARSEHHQLATISLTRVECRAAIRRRERGGDIDPEVAAQVMQDLEQHFASRFLIQPITEALLEEACTLIEHHPLQAYDSIQLAGCVTLRGITVGESPVFVCSDRQLLRAAAEQGLAVLNPLA